MIQTAKEIVSDLLKFYEKRLSPAMVMFYECALESYDEDLLCRAINNLKAAELPTRFPTVAIIRKYYFEEKDARWQQRKMSEPGYSKLSKLDIPATRETYENFREVMDGIGKMPKDQWLRIAVDRGMLKPGDVETMRESWQQMGADPVRWRKDGPLS